MTEREKNSPRGIEWTLKAFSMAEIAIGAIMALTPIGAPGIILILTGGTQLALIEKQKRKK